MSIAFGTIVDGQFTAALDGFHAWIECKGYAIDFLTRLFPENVAEIDHKVETPRRAFMKSLSLISTRVPQRGDTEGTFLLIQDEVCEANMIQSSYRTPLPCDLQAISSNWYRRPPKKMDIEQPIKDGLGRVTCLKRENIAIEGFWYRSIERGMRC
jgi:hypothetical protein